jgi:hypothetical protein
MGALYVSFISEFALERNVTVLTRKLLEDCNVRYHNRCNTNQQIEGRIRILLRPLH